jgi:uncharacterized protein YqiB (DUF1249 family)
MKLSKLQALLSRIENKHGDVEVCFHDKDDAYEVSVAEDCRYDNAIARMLTNSNLPGLPLDEEETKEPANPFAVLFLS